MLYRISVLIKWVVYNSLMFCMLCLVVNPLAAANIAMLMTVGAFFHPSNKREVFQLKRPELWVSKNDPLARFATN